MKLSGIIVAPATPMSDDSRDLAVKTIFESYYQFPIERKVSGMLIGGTTGEGILLSLLGPKKIADYAVGIVAHAVPTQLLEFALKA